jgi:hypothetical protein
MVLFSKSTFLVALLAFCGLCVSASAQLTASESFNYLGGTVVGQNGGTGFSGAWLQSATNTGVLNVVTTSTLGGGGTIAHTVANTGFGKLTKLSTTPLGEVQRPMTTAFNLSTTQTFYMSAIFRKNGTTATNDDIYVGWARNSDGFSRGFFGINGSEQFVVRMQAAGTQGIVTGRAAAANTSYLLVCKVDTTNSGAGDKLSLKVYGPGQKIDFTTTTMTWDATYTESSSVDAQRLVVYTAANASALGNDVDEIRVGKSWNAVIPANVDQLLYEPFDYTAGAAEGQFYGGRLGLSTNWATTTAMTMDVAAGKLGLDTNGAYLNDSNGALAETRLTDAVDLNTTGTRYFSAFIQQDAVGGPNQYINFLFKSDTGVARWMLGTNSAGQFFTGVASQTAFGTVVPGQTYFIVGRMNISAAPDVSSLKIYTGDPDVAEPALYDVTNASLSGTILTRLVLDIGSGNTNAQVDDLRMGYTWESVTTGVHTPVELSTFSAD